MPFVIKRPVVFVCKFCGNISLDRERVIVCESQGILLPVCREGDILELCSWPITSTKEYINGGELRVIGQDDQLFTANSKSSGCVPNSVGDRFKVIGFTFDRVEEWLGPVAGFRLHGPPIQVKCQKADGTEIDILYPVDHITKTDTLPKKFLDWKEYFKEIEECNPSARKDRTFRKYRSGNYMAKMLRVWAKDAAYA